MQNKLKVLRAIHKLTQEELAEGLGISRQALSDIENSKTIPGGRLMLRISNFFKLPVEEVFYEEGTGTN